MAVSSGVSDRKSDRISGKNTSEDFSENRLGRTGCRYSGSDPCVSVKRGNPFSDPAYSLRDFSMGGIRTGDILVLSASGNEISENREHESL